MATGGHGQTGQNSSSKPSGSNSTGGGGGFGANGGTGVVIIKYAGNVAKGSGGNSIAVHEGYVYHKFTGSGTFTA